VNPLNVIWNFLGRTYHRLASPREFYRISLYVTPVFGFLFLTLTLVGTYYGLFVAPADYQQGESYRIIFVHVPSAWLSMFIYTTMAIAGAIGLIWRMKMAFVVAICSAPIGAAFTALALITGSIWGKPIWGTWWVWDARLTSELILLFLYFGVMATYYAFEDRKTAERAMALLSVVGVVIVPIIHYSVEWWSTLHQPATITKIGKPSIHPSMGIPLFLMVFAFQLLYAYVLLLRTRIGILQREARAAWVAQLPEVSRV